MFWKILKIDKYKDQIIYFLKEYNKSKKKVFFNITILGTKNSYINIGGKHYHTKLLHEQLRKKEMIKIF